MQVIMYQANAFTDKLFEGNPVGIVPDAKKLREEDMKNIVKITNLNKVVFITDEEEGCYNLRFFNSEEEMSSCDCGTIASFYALAERGYIDGVENGVVRTYECTEIGKRPIDIYFKDGDVYRVELCNQKPVIVCEDIDINILSQLLNIDSEKIGLINSNAKPEIMFKGSKYMIVPIKTNQTLNNIVIDVEKIKSNPLTKDIDKLYAFSIDSEEVINYVCFELAAKESCIYEDTTSRLICYIKKNELLNNNHFVCKDNSLKYKHNYMHCDVIENNDDYSIKIGGRASIYLEGVVTYG